MPFRSRIVVAAALVAGCSWDAPPVEWEAPTPIASRADTAAQFAARWTPGATPEVVVSPVVDTAIAPAVTGTADLRACPGSIVTAQPVRGRRWSAWWQIRDDSSAALIAEERDSASAMLQRIVIDSVDVALLGCARPAPSITVDNVNGYVHVAYYMVGPEGPGLFYSHLMDPRLARFETPMALVYGEKPVRVTVASRADTVALAYEDPNSAVGRIALSMSTTSGHLFEQTARLIPVSTSSQQASAPQIVRLSGGQLWVGWREESQSGSAFLLRRARIVTR
ncbi:MAG TPA: hypothetical protein VE861_01465 [Gemmatimonadaceae bacterium]|nr:hypothetical protein [Gemmatimonadaceae bacterium]